MIDSHCHPRNLEDLEEARAVGVKGFVTAAVQVDDPAVDGDDVIRLVGLHPWSANTSAALAELDATLARIRAVLGDGAAVGVGEIGMDRSRRRAGSVGCQKRAFEAQLRLAVDLDRPIALHCVRAHGAVLDALETIGCPDAGGLVHGFHGSIEVARAYIAHGLKISFGLTLLRYGREGFHATVQALSPEHLLVETDVGGCARLPEVVEAVARMRKVSPSAIAEQTAENARRLFPALRDSSGAV